MLAFILTRLIVSNNANKRSQKFEWEAFNLFFLRILDITFVKHEAFQNNDVAPSPVKSISSPNLVEIKYLLSESSTVCN